MRAGDGVGVREIGDRSRNADDAMKGTRGQMQPFGGSLEQATAGGIERRDALQLRSGQRRVDP